MSSCSSLFKSDQLIFFKFRNFKFDLKENLVNNLKNYNAWRFINSYAWKWCVVWTKYLGNQILYRSLVPSKNKRCHIRIHIFHNTDQYRYHHWYHHCLIGHICGKIAFSFELSIASRYFSNVYVIKARLDAS